MSARTRLLNAMGELLKTTSIDQITVGDLADAADVSRQSLYRLYGDKYELLKDFYRETILVMYDTFESIEDVYRGSYRTFCYFRDNPDITRNMFFSKDSYSLKQYMRNLCYEADLQLWRSLGAEVDDPFIRGAVREYAYGTVSHILEWIKGGMPDSPEEMSRQSLYAIPVGLFLGEGLRISVDDLKKY